MIWDILPRAAICYHLLFSHAYYLHVGLCMIKIPSHLFILENQIKPGLWLKLQEKSHGIKHLPLTLLSMKSQPICLNIQPDKCTPNLKSVIIGTKPLKPNFDLTSVIRSSCVFYYHVLTCFLYNVISIRFWPFVSKISLFLFSKKKSQQIKHRHFSTCPPDRGPKS